MRRPPIYFTCCMCWLADIDSSFKENLVALVPLLVSGDGLMVKKINGNPVTGSGLLDCFQVGGWAILCVLSYCVFIHRSSCVVEGLHENLPK